MCDAQIGMGIGKSENKGRLVQCTASQSITNEIFINDVSAKEFQIFNFHLLI